MFWKQKQWKVDPKPLPWLDDTGKWERSALTERTAKKDMSSGVLGFHQSPEIEHWACRVFIVRRSTGQWCFCTALCGEDTGLRQLDKGGMDSTLLRTASPLDLTMCSGVFGLRFLWISLLFSTCVFLFGSFCFINSYLRVQLSSAFLMLPLLTSVISPASCAPSSHPHSLAGSFWTTLYCNAEFLPAPYTIIELHMVRITFYQRDWGPGRRNASCNYLHCCSIQTVLFTW